MTLMVLNGPQTLNSNKHLLLSHCIMSLGKLRYQYSSASYARELTSTDIYFFCLTDWTNLISTILFPLVRFLLVGWLVVLRLNVPVNNFQSYRDGATASWVINQYFRGVKCLAQGHNTAAVGFEPPTSRSGVRHSTTEPPRSPIPLVFRV